MILDIHYLPRTKVKEDAKRSQYADPFPIKDIDSFQVMLPVMQCTNIPEERIQPWNTFCHAMTCQPARWLYQERTLPRIYHTCISPVEKPWIALPLNWTGWTGWMDGFIEPWISAIDACLLYLDGCRGVFEREKIMRMGGVCVPDWLWWRDCLIGFYSANAYCLLLNFWILKRWIGESL